MILNTKDYFNNNIINKNKEYNIFLVKNNKDIDDMINFFILFKNDKKNNKYIGLDFEFNSSPDGKKIALFQINLEDSSNKARIYLFYPPDLNKENTNILKSLLMDSKIKKILHGAESLDIPYLFKNIFITSKERQLFCNNLFDTRYMCEYMHLDLKLNEKCKIYSILLELKVITKDQYNNLLKNEEEMGPIYEVDIDVRNLDKNTMLYSAFDVLYLPRLLEQFPENDIYEKLIPQLTCFNFIDRYEDIFTKPFSELLNKANNYFLFTSNNKKIKLIDVFNYYYFTRKGIILHFMEINYYKKFLETFIKFIIYKNVIKLYKVYMKNDVLEDISKDLLKLEIEFTKINLPDNFNRFFSDLRKELKQEIILM